jgi:hypothetical protein
MKRIGLESLLYEQNEKIEYGSMFEGDFNSNASTQSWGEFWGIFVTFGPVVAVSREVSSWHGERKLNYYKTPYYLTVKDYPKIPLPENYKVSFIKSGMRSSDFLDNVKVDDKGDYYEYTESGQSIKFYLPNDKFFSKYTNVPYKFQTETGDEYSLILTLKSSRTTSELQLGSDTSQDDMSISISNLNPDNGNGWGFLEPIDLTGEKFEYYKKVGGLYEPYNIFIMDQSVKSSFQLWWEKWGIVTQIVASIGLGFFSGGLTAFIEGIFSTLAEAEALAGGAGAFSSISTWLSASGSFNASRATILALFMLETTVNSSAAYIDYKFNNVFGAVLGVAFCFFPVISNYGKLGKWIKGRYSKESVDSLIQKIMSSGINETATKEQMYEFIINLTAEEKLMWSEVMKLLSKKEGVEALQETLKEVFQNASKNKDLPSKFKSWLSGGSGSEFFKTLIAAGIFFVDVSKWYLIIEQIKNLSKDKRTTDQVFTDAQDNINKNIKPKFKSSETSSKINIKKTNDIIKEDINKKSQKEGGKLIYALSNGSDLTYFETLVANEKLKSLEEQLKNDEKLVDYTVEDFKIIINMINEINASTDNPINKETLINWVSTPNLDDDVSTFLSNYSDDIMSKEINYMVKHNKCLATNFEYVDGFSFTNDYALNFKVIKPINVKYNNGANDLSLKVGDDIWLHSKGLLSFNDKEYVGFKCS